MRCDLIVKSLILNAEGRGQLKNVFEPGSYGVERPFGGEKTRCRLASSLGRAEMLAPQKCTQHACLVLSAPRPWPPPVSADAAVNAAFEAITESAAAPRRD